MFVRISTYMGSCPSVNSGIWRVELSESTGMEFINKLHYTGTVPAQFLKAVNRTNNY
jgi:hypothetical protein